MNTLDLVKNEVYANVNTLVYALQEKDCEAMERLYDMHGSWEDEDGEIIEPLEYWMVSEWLGKKLAAKNELIWENGYEYIWGRTISGQSITIDGVIEEIVKEVNDRFD